MVAVQTDSAEGRRMTDGRSASAAYGRDLPKRRVHLTVFEKLERAEEKIRQAHKRAARFAPQRADEEWGREPGVSAVEQRAYAVGVLHGLGTAVRYLNEANAKGEG